MTDERHKWYRRYDMAAITALLLLAGTVYTMAKHPVQWDQNTADLADLKPRVSKVEANVQEIRDINQAQMTMIVRELDGIHREMKIGREAYRSSEAQIQDVARDK